MPQSTAFWGASGENLTMAVNNGSLTESRVTDMATRIIAAWYQMGQDARCPDKSSRSHADVNLGGLSSAWYWNATRLRSTAYSCVCS